MHKDTSTIIHWIILHIDVNNISCFTVMEMMENSDGQG